MDKLTFTIEDVPGTRVLGARTVVPEQQVADAIGRVFGQLFGAVGPRVTGSPLTVFPEGYDPERVVLEPSVPYDGDPPYGYAIRELPACRAVVGHLTGPYDGLPDAWRATMQYMEGEGLELDGPPYERYRVGVGDAEPEAFETDIVVPVK